jgi:hypothetical protein
VGRTYAPGMASAEPAESAESAGRSGPALPDDSGEELWETYADRLAALLGPLEAAGWEIPEWFSSEGAPGASPLLFGELRRGRSALGFAFRPEEGKLHLQPPEPRPGPGPGPANAREALSALAEETVVDVGVRAGAAGAAGTAGTVGGAANSGRAGPGGEEAVAAVERRAGELGLLDALHVRLAPGTPEAAVREFEAERLMTLFGPAAAYRGLPVAHIVREAYDDPEVQPLLLLLLGTAGRGVEPDVVPGAVAIGVAAWCWRNGTAVEDHHLATDVLMARVNIAATRAVLPHVDPEDGVDWDGVGAALTSPDWALPDGRRVAALFGGAWPEVSRTVREQVRFWRRLDRQLFGPETVLRLLTIAGSTGYTWTWWGQGRWRAICERIVRDAITHGLALPPPYDRRGPGALVSALATAPDRESDEVLEWFIDLPQGGAEGPYGLRHHEVTQPVVRTHEPWWEA